MSNEMMDYAAEHNKKFDFSKFDDMDFAEWHAFGSFKGWVSEVFCDMHEGGPLTDEEDAEVSEGGDPCLPHIRIWEDKLS